MLLKVNYGHFCLSIPMSIFNSQHRITGPVTYCLQSCLFVFSLRFGILLLLLLKSPIILPQFKMASCMNCFRRCCDGNVGGSYVQMKEQPAVLLDTSHMGVDAVIVKNGRRLCGTGGALATVPIVQNKAYFEMKLQQSGLWGVGLATRHSDMSRIPLGRDKESWVLTSEGTIVHNRDILYKLSEMPMEGDVVGVSYDHVEINFYVNGKNIMCPVTGAKGEVFPVMYVDDGAILDAAFTNFTHQPPSGFDRIMVEKSLL